MRRMRRRRSGRAIPAILRNCTTRRTRGERPARRHRFLASVRRRSLEACRWGSVRSSRARRGTPSHRQAVRRSPRVFERESGCRSRNASTTASFPRARWSTCVHEHPALRRRATPLRASGAAGCQRADVLFAPRPSDVWVAPDVPRLEQAHRRGRSRTRVRTEPAEKVVADQVHRAMRARGASAAAADTRCGGLPPRASRRRRARSELAVLPPGAAQASARGFPAEATRMPRPSCEASSCARKCPVPEMGSRKPPRFNHQAVRRVLACAVRTPCRSRLSARRRAW